MKKNIMIFCLLSLTMIFCLNGCKRSSNITTNKTSSATSSYKTKYTITNYQYTTSSETWMYILVNKNATQEELKGIAKELHNNYPTTCFYLYSTIETIKLMYNYDSTNSYATNKFTYPETNFDRDNMGIINKMAGKWSYTNSIYDSTKLG